LPNSRYRFITLRLTRFRRLRIQQRPAYECHRALFRNGGDDYRQT